MRDMLETPVKGRPVPSLSTRQDTMTYLRTALLEQQLWRHRLLRVHEATARRQEARIRLLGSRLKEKA